MRHCRNPDCRKEIVTTEVRGYCNKECKMTKKKTAPGRIAKKREASKIPYGDKKWLRLRYEVFRRDGKKCALCGATGRLHVDHIKPKWNYPELKYNLNNLQVLCEECNLGKGKKYQDDWRKLK